MFDKLVLSSFLPTKNAENESNNDKFPHEYDCILYSDLDLPPATPGTPRKSSLYCKPSDRDSVENQSWFNLIVRVRD